MLMSLSVASPQITSFRRAHASLGDEDDEPILAVHV